MQLSEVWIRNYTGSVSYPEKVAPLHYPSKFGNVQGKCFYICWSFCHSGSSTSPCPEGSFLAPEISRLFGDTVGASLVSTAVATSCQHTTHVSQFNILWLMSTAVATSCQHTIHVSQFIFFFAINHKLIFGFHVSKLHFSTIASTPGSVTRAVNCEIMLMHKPKTSSGFTCQVIQQRFMIMVPTLPVFWTSDLLSWLTFRSALWTGSCCQVDPYPSQYHPEPLSHQVCKTSHWPSQLSSHWSFHQ